MDNNWCGMEDAAFWADQDWLAFKGDVSDEIRKGNDTILGIAAATGGCHADIQRAAKQLGMTLAGWGRVPDEKDEATRTINAIRRAFDAGTPVKAFAIFNEIDDDEIYAAVLKVYPNIVQYDAKGNYVGAVANENGWTP